MFDTYAQITRQSVRAFYVTSNFFYLRCYFFGGVGVGVRALTANQRDIVCWIVLLSISEELIIIEDASKSL